MWPQVLQLSVTMLASDKLYNKNSHYFSRKNVKLQNKRPMGLNALLENQLGHLPKFQKLDIYSISTSGVKIELMFTL